MQNLSWHAAGWVILSQFGRRNLTLFQRAELALKLKPRIAERAKEKQLAEGRELGGAATLSQKSDKGSIDTKRELAKIASVSHDTIAKAEVIIEKAPEPVKEAVRRGESNTTASV